MNHSGDAAEQIVRMSLEGVEVAARITGNAAKDIAAFLLAALKSPDKADKGLKLKGKARMATMLKSGKALEIYSIRESDLKKVYQGAKQYGIVYCILRNKKSTTDGLCDILVKADDAPKINRLAERFGFATVDKAKIESEIVAEKAIDAKPEVLEINDTEKLLDDLLGIDEGKIEPDKTEKESMDSRPFDSEPLKSNPSEPISESKSSSEKASSKIPWSGSKTSVRDELREIKAAKKVQESDAPAQEDKPPSGKKKNDRQAPKHQQLQGGKRLKPKKSKGKHER